MSADKVSTPQSFMSMTKFDSKQPPLSVSGQPTGHSCSHMTGKGRVAAVGHFFKLLGTLSLSKHDSQASVSTFKFCFSSANPKLVNRKCAGLPKSLQGEVWRFWLESLGWEWMVMSS